MPRYRFRWEIVPTEILDDLARGLDLDGDTLVQLRRRYGARPTTQFVREAWSVLREGWLSRDDALREWVVGELRGAGLGDSKVEDERGYLLSCRNAETLRRVVLIAFHVLGEGDLQAPNEPPQPQPEVAAGGARRPEPEFDLDAAIESAWAAFSEGLRGLIATIDPDSSLIIGLPTALELAELQGAAPYVQVLGLGEEQLRGEVSGNAFLDPRLHLSEAQQHALTAIGWNRPIVEADGDGVPNFYVDLPVTSAARLADMTVAAARAVFDVPHPSFLDLGGAPESADSAVTGSGDLRQQVEGLLAARFEQPVVHDSDGDIPIRSGSAMVFVRTSTDLPIVELFSPLLLGVSGDALALERLNRVNRRLRFARLTWSRGTVMASHEVWCEPFVPELLMRAVEMMMELADELDDGLRSELGGRGFFEEATPAPAAEVESDALHPALATIVQLTPSGDELTAAQAARICGFDRDLVLTLITDSDSQAIDWRKSAADAEVPAEVAACEHEAAAWDKTAALLREALREIVLP